MSKKTVHIIASVALGLAVFGILSTLISMLFDVLLTKDAITILSPGESAEEVISYVKHSSIGVICIAVPMLTSFCMTFFSKDKKVFGIISLVLTLLLAAMCIGFIFDLNKIVLGLTSSQANSYTIATTYFSELITLLTACLLVGAYFTVVTVMAFKTKLPKTGYDFSDGKAQPTIYEKGEEAHEKD